MDYDLKENAYKIVRFPPYFRFERMKSMECPVSSVLFSWAKKSLLCWIFNGSDFYLDVYIVEKLCDRSLLPANSFYEKTFFESCAIFMKLLIYKKLARIVEQPKKISFLLQANRVLILS